MEMAKPGIKVEAPSNNNKEETQNNQVDEESIIKLTCRLITAIDKKINYKLLFFLSLSIIIGFYILSASIYGTIEIIKNIIEYFK